MARRVITAEAASRKWERRMQTASEDYSAGVNAVQDSPMEAAAMAKGKYVAGVQAAAQSGRYERGLERVSLGDWKDAAVNKGAARLASGATQAAPKVRETMAKIMANEEEVKRILDAMPTDTLEQRIARSTKWQIEMSKRPVK